MRLLPLILLVGFAAGCVRKVPAAAVAPRSLPPVATAAPVAPAAEAPAVAPDPADALAQSLALERIHFRFDEAQLTPQAQATLQQIAELIRASPVQPLIEISGHTDERGTLEYNLALGHRRAEAARRYLADLGVDSTKLRIISYGAERPLATTHDELAWSANRRAELHVAN